MTPPTSAEPEDDLGWVNAPGTPPTQTEVPPGPVRSLEPKLTEMQKMLKRVLVGSLRLPILAEPITINYHDKVVR